MNEELERFRVYLPKQLHQELLDYMAVEGLQSKSRTVVKIIQAYLQQKPTKGKQNELSNRQH